MHDTLEELSTLFRAHYPYVYLVSWEEDRVLRTLAQLSQGRTTMAVWSMNLGFPGVEGSGDPLACLDHIEQGEGGRIYCLRDFHTALKQPNVVRRLRDLESNLVEQQKMVVIVSPILSVPRELEKDIEVIDVPLPQAREVARMLSRVLQAQGITMPPDLYERTVKASLGLTEKEILRVYTRILVGGGGFDDAGLNLVIQEKKRILRRNQFLEFLEISESLEDVGGMGQLKEWLDVRGRSFTERARQFGLPQPKGLFMLGVQGCGKSLTAKAVAKAWRMPLIRMDVGALVTSGTDHESGLRETIRIAESMSPVVLWIDEIEKAFAGSSGASAEGGATRILGALLTWLQEKAKPVFVIATANDVKNLPPELLRKGRFDEIFFIDLPNVHDREAILKIHIAKRARDPKLFDLYAVAEVTDKFSGAELEQLVIASLFTAFAKEREVTTRDMLQVARESVPLARTMDQSIKDLKEWAGPRTRPAAWDTRRIDFFEEWVSDAL